MNWTQPVCDPCYATKEPEREPFRMKEPELERCCFCGKQTLSGIYYRVDPRTVPYPTAEKEAE